MPQKQGKFNQDKKLRRDKLFENHEHQPIRKPIIFGCDDIGRRKMTSKPIQHFGEFGSYFYAPNRQADPVYSMTSHTAKECKQPHRSVINTYPSLTQNLRWNPNVESSSVYQSQTNDRQNAEERSNITCRCRDCGSKHCRGQSIPSDFVPRPGIFKDNITRFADNTTMTLNLNDACCGSSTPVYASCKKTSDVSVSGSNIAVRDNYCAMALSQVYVNCDPVSILKKTRPVKDYGRDEYDSRSTETEKKCKIMDDYQEAVRDIEDNEYEDLMKSKTIRSFPKINRNKLQDNFSDEVPPRKNIYNEGISDLLVNCLPPVPPPSYFERFPSQTSAKKNYSNTSIKRSASKREDVPFSHYSDSKYHYDCTAELCYPSSSSERVTTKAKKFKKTYPSKPVPWHNTQSVKFPRKLLSSERDIESYISQSQNSSYR